MKLKVENDLTKKLEVMIKRLNFQQDIHIKWNYSEALYKKHIGTFNIFEKVFFVLCIFNL